jgi:hypothetical protein
MKFKEKLIYCSPSTLKTGDRFTFRCNPDNYCPLMFLAAHPGIEGSFFYLRETTDKQTYLSNIQTVHKIVNDSWDESGVEIGDEFYITDLGISEGTWKVVDRSDWCVIMTQADSESLDIQVRKVKLGDLVSFYGYCG